MASFQGLDNPFLFKGLEYLKGFWAFIEEGGFLFMLPLLVLCIVLWFAVGYRGAILRRGRKRPLYRLISEYIEDQSIPPTGVIDLAIKKAISSMDMVHEKSELSAILDEIIHQSEKRISTFKGTISVIVMVAPLIGLLGTVDGMIDMFQSLVDGALFTQNGGIAAGIAKALSTTEFGLVIAAPGLIFHHILNRRERLLREELYQLKYHLLSIHDTT